MEDISVVRTITPVVNIPAQPGTPPGTGDTLSVPDTVPLPSERVKAGKLPLVVDLLEAGPAYKTFSVEKQTKEIDDHINSEIQRQHLKDDPGVYESILARYAKRLNLQQLSTYPAIEKLVQYVRLQEKIWQGLQEQERLERADPLTLTAQQIKKYYFFRHKNGTP